MADNLFLFLIEIVFLKKLEKDCFVNFFELSTNLCSAC